jgi:hypothetical protein
MIDFHPKAASESLGYTTIPIDSSVLLIDWPDPVHFFSVAICLIHTLDPSVIPRTGNFKKCAHVLHRIFLSMIIDHSVAGFCFESLRNSPWNFLAVHAMRPSPAGQYRQPDPVSCAVGLLIYVIPTHPLVDKLIPRLQCVLHSGSPIAPQWYDRPSVLPKTVALLPLLPPHYSAHSSSS